MKTIERIVRDENFAQHPKKFLLAWAGLVCAAVLAVITLLDIGVGHPWLDEIRAQVEYRLIAPVSDAVRYGILTYEMMPLLLAVFLLQFVIPARPDEKLLRYNLFVDFLFLLTTALQMTFLVVVYVAFLQALHQSLLGGYTLFDFAEWPIWLQAVTAIVLYDFLRYVHHWLNHKIPFLWEFHAVHHAQKQLNLFSNYRVHAVDLWVELTVTAIPFLLLGFSMPTIIGVSLFVGYWPQIYHANLKINLGPLHYIFVTPQSHRIHHSFAPEHIDKNLARIFSFWDALFGTRCWDTQIYPKTGIPDSAFPAEMPASLWVALAQPIVQLIYPFEVVWHKYIRRAKPSRLAGSAAE